MQPTLQTSLAWRVNILSVLYLSKKAMRSSQTGKHSRAVVCEDSERESEREEEEEEAADEAEDGRHL